MVHQNELPKHSFFVFTGIFISLAIAYLANSLVELPFKKPKTLKE